jgi:hypothetical protein
MSGAATGAMVGGPKGAIIGAVAGGVLGGVSGGMSGGGGGGGGGMDKKFLKMARQTADEGLQKSNRSVKKLYKDQEKNNAAYRANMAGYSNEFMGRINTAIGAAPDYWTTVQKVDEGKAQLQNDFDTRSSTLAEDSANQAMDWNEANATRMIAFSQALQKANEQSAMEGAFAANPELKGLIGQLGRNAMNDARGILDADFAAQLSRNAAQGTLGAGTGLGSQLGNNLTFRDFGIGVMARRDKAVENTALLQNQIVNPILAGTKVNSFDVSKWMGLDTSQVLDTNRQTLTNWAQMGIDRWDDMRSAGDRVLDTRSAAATYDYGQKGILEGNIYQGNTTTYNNAAGLRNTAIRDWTNARLGAGSQAWANEQARGAQASENNTALMVAGMNSAATAAGAYYGSRKGTSLTNTSTGSYDSRLNDPNTPYLGGAGNTATDR